MLGKLNWLGLFLFFMLRRFLGNRSWFVRTKVGRRPNYPKRGGDLGEEIVLEYCERKFPDASSILQSIRIPDPDTYQSKGEVDIIICLSKATYFLEVKHWRGLVDANHKGEFYTEYVSGKPIQDRVQKKADSAKRMFRSRFGKSIGDVYPLIVFSHDQCRLSDNLNRKSNVLRLRDLSAVIRELEEGVGDELDESVVGSIEIMLRYFGTWDNISFDEGSYLIGT